MIPAWNETLCIVVRWNRNGLHRLHPAWILILNGGAVHLETVSVVIFINNNSNNNCNIHIINSSTCKSTIHRWIQRRPLIAARNRPHHSRISHPWKLLWLGCTILKRLRSPHHRLVQPIGHCTCIRWVPITIRTFIIHIMLRLYNNITTTDKPDLTSNLDLTNLCTCVCVHVCVCVFVCRIAWIHFSLSLVLFVCFHFKTRIFSLVMTHETCSIFWKHN